MIVLLQYMSTFWNNNTLNYTVVRYGPPGTEVYWISPDHQYSQLPQYPEFFQEYLQSTADVSSYKW